MLISYTGKSPLVCPNGFEHVIIMPGGSEITDEQWKAIEKIPMIAKLVDDKQMVVTKSGKSKEAVDSIASLEPKKAAEFVKQTYDLKSLEQWASVEKRGPVLLAIKEQIALVKKPDEAEKDESKEG